MKRIIVIGIAIFIAVCAGVFLFSLNKTQTTDELLIHDVSRLFPVYVQEIVKTQQEEGLVEAVIKAKEQGLKVSIAGKRHSQGGHSFYEDSVHLDMTDFNEIIDLDVESKTIRVQSGATWEDIQEAAHPYGLAVKVMQSSNIFTVGGSLSANAHGRDVRYGPIIETVNSFRLLRPDGTIIHVSCEENQELFSLVIGGYGLFGVILDVELQLTDNVWYEVHNQFLDYTEYPDYFLENVLGDSDAHLHIARLSVSPDAYLTEMYAHTYVQTRDVTQEQMNERDRLAMERNVARNRFLFGLSRHWEWGKKLIWDIQKRKYSPEDTPIVHRNNAMRPEIEFLEYHADKDTDLLQEYFIPIEHFADYVDDLRELLREEGLNLVNITVRYVPENEEAYVSYTKQDSFALVFLINQGLDEKERLQTEKTTQRLVDLALEYDGTYYLTYQLYPTMEQLERTYPQIRTFFELKKKFDPEQRFMNKFYERYAHEKYEK